MPKRFWEAYSAWSGGRMHSGPRWPGSLQDQPAWLFDAVTLLEAEYQLITLARQEEARNG